MKKAYIHPFMQVVTIGPSQMLCLSSSLDDPATEPAKAPGLEWFEDDDEFFLQDAPFSMGI